MHFGKAINSLAFCAILGSAQALETELSNSIRNTSVTSSANRRLQTAACTLLLKVTTYEDGHEEESVDCFDEETKSYSKIATVRGSDYIQSELLSKFKKGELQSAESTLMHEGAFYEANTLVLPSDSVAKAEFGKNTHSRRRRRLAVSGTRTFLAVRVVATDSSPTPTISQISDEWFGTYGDPVNYKSQIEACSYNTVSVSKFTGSGVTEGVVTANIGTSVTGKDDGYIADLAKTAVNNLNLGNPDHTILCLPPGTSGDWIGWAYIDSDISVYNDDWCLYPSIQMHEIGHNWNLAHSNYNGDTYGDKTGVMGYSYSSDNGPEMCFNAPKNRQLGWYSDRTVTVNSGWSGRLYGLVSYSSSSPGDAVILYIPSGTNGSTRDYYVSFNGYSGINSGSQMAGNQVLVHYRDPGTDYAQSTLISMLNSGTTYTGAPLTITVSSISGSTFAQVTVGTGVSTPTQAPTPTPLSPTGNPYLSTDGNCSNCGLCVGDCDDDSDCQGDLRCAQRSNSNGLEDVVGCDFPGTDRFPSWDFCFPVQTVSSGVINYVGECGTENYLCSRCEGDCDSDADCTGNLVCQQRSGLEAVTGCSGEGGSTDVYAKDICVDPENPDPTPSPTRSPTPSPTKAPTSAPVPSPVASPVLLDDSSCLDFPDRFKFTKTKIITCDDMTPYRCSKDKGKSLCPNACGTTADWCGDNLRDAKGRVEIGIDANGDIKWKGCAFVRNRPDKIALRCRKGNIALACRATCQNV